MANGTDKQNKPCYVNKSNMTGSNNKANYEVMMSIKQITCALHLLLDKSGGDIRGPEHN